MILRDSVHTSSTIYQRHLTGWRFCGLGIWSRGSTLLPGALSSEVDDCPAEGYLQTALPQLLWGQSLTSPIIGEMIQSRSIL